MHPQALHVSAAGLLSASSMAVQIPTTKVSLPTDSIVFFYMFHFKNSFFVESFKANVMHTSVQCSKNMHYII